MSANTKPEVIERLLEERRQRGTSEDELSLWYEWFLKSPWKAGRFDDDDRATLDGIADVIAGRVISEADFLADMQDLRSELKRRNA